MVADPCSLGMGDPWAVFHRSRHQTYFYISILGLLDDDLVDGPRISYPDFGCGYGFYCDLLVDPFVELADALLILTFFFLLVLTIRFLESQLMRNYGSVSLEGPFLILRSDPNSRLMKNRHSPPLLFSRTVSSTPLIFLE